MKDIALNSFNSNQRKMLQIGVAILLAVFLIVYFFFQLNGAAKNNEVILEDSKLQVFDDTYTFNGYPDKILIHYPYFLLVQAEKPLTIVYNLETKEKEKDAKDVLLDYYKGNIVYNKKDSYFNDKNLGEFCDSAFIKSTEEVLCITKRSRDSVDNMIISINPEKPNLWKRVYQSDNILTAVSVIDNNLYVGEINFKTKQNYISINGKTLPVESTVNVIYEMEGKPYFVSFKNVYNDKARHYIINGKSITQETESKIYFYR